MPHILTPEEEKMMGDYLENVRLQTLRSIPTPPPGEVRTMAEWEEIQALVITWAGHTAILREIVRNAVKECKVLIITTNEASVTSTLTNAGIPLDSVRFVNTPFNTIWVRDYGPWTVYQNDVDSLYLIDWIYNRPRAQDDATPLAIAEYLNIPVYEAIVDPDDFVHTGGNHLPDGMGTAFSSLLVLEENSDKTEDEIDSIAKKYLGVKQYIKFPTLPYDGIHHLDMHMRVIDEETIIFGEYPDGKADGPQINANIDYLLSEHQTSFGNQYNIVRIPMPPQNDEYPDQGGDYRTYTNSIFINKTILVPTYEEKYDTTALRIYRENLPGYNVVGINCNSIIPSLGALHCITKLVGTSDPLMIAHARLRDDSANVDFPVEAIIKHRSGIESAHLHYRLKGDSLYQNISMHLTDTLENLWTSMIPSQLAGSEIQYYIKAKAFSGKEQVRPIVAPQGYFKFKILGEPANQPPVVRIAYPPDGSVFNIDAGKLDIEINANDEDGSITQLMLNINADSFLITDSLPSDFVWVFESAGDYQIKASAIDDKGAETVSEVVSVTVEETTAVDPIDKAQLEVYPNPVRDVLWIKQVADAMTDISVTDLYGRFVPLAYRSQGVSASVDFSPAPAGVYFVKVAKDGKTEVLKVIKL